MVMMLLRSKLFLLSPAPIQTKTRGGDQNMQGIECYAPKISMIEKTPTPHDRTNAALPSVNLLIAIFPNNSLTKYCVIKQPIDQVTYMSRRLNRRPNVSGDQIGGQNLY